MTTEQIKQYIEKLHQELETDLMNLSNEMEGTDENSKDYADLDIEYTFISGQITGLGHILDKINS